MYYLHMLEPSNHDRFSFGNREVDQLILDDPCTIVMDELQLHTTMHLRVPLWFLFSLSLSQPSGQCVFLINNQVRCGKGQALQSHW